MEIAEKIRSIISQKGKAAIVTMLGCSGLLLIMLSSLITEDKPVKEIPSVIETADAENYRISAEKRLESFLRGVEGAGQVRVCLTVSSGERTVYASEDRSIHSQDRTEEESNYVIIGGNSERSALVEKIELPEIAGAAVLCTGGGSPVVQERIYKAVSAILGLPPGRIYVTELKEETL